MLHIEYNDFERSIGPRIRAAEIHWFFVQGSVCHRQELYFASCTTFLCGIEAALRFTVTQFSGNNDLSRNQVLSNKLIREADQIGLPIDKLAFSNESDFLRNLKSSGSNQVNVEIVRNRHNVCHGNCADFVEAIPETDDSILTPECLRQLSTELLRISEEWIPDLASFRRSMDR